jgi:cellobiose-specific phosphotransferase system component IIC
MPDGLGSIIMFVCLVGLMAWAMRTHIRSNGLAGAQEQLVQLTRTSIALVSTFTVSYALINGIVVSEGFLALYGVIIALYFKGELAIRPPAAEPRGEP